MGDYTLIGELEKIFESGQKAATMNTDPEVAEHLQVIMDEWNIIVVRLEVLGLVPK